MQKLAPLMLVLFWAPLSMADPISFATSGFITSYLFRGGPDPGIQVGDPFTGTLNYEINTDGTVAEWSATFTMTVNGYDFSSWDSSGVYLLADNPVIDPINPSSYFIFVSSACLNPWDWVDGDAYFACNPGSNPMLRFRGTGDAFFDTDIHIGGEVTSMTQVPDSAGLAIELMSALLIVVGVRRFRRRNVVKSLPGSLSVK